jgi:hypothetical protein
MAEGFAHDGSRGGVIPALSLVDLSQELDPFIRLYVAPEHPTYAAFVQLVVDDSVGLGTSLDFPGSDLVLGQLSICQV